jgi:S-adenosylmethionine hydrolase
MRSLILLQTDFTTKEGAVASMKGVIKQVARLSEVHDLSHDIPPFDVWSASFRIHQSLRFWPEDTLLVSVVDPGVGTDRRACVAVMKSGHTILTPDNGSLTHVFNELDAVYEIDSVQHRFPSPFANQVFHGRDVFAYVAARLAAATLQLSDLKPYPLSEIQRLPVPAPDVVDDTLVGILEIQDPNFGNCWTNIPVEYLEAIGVNEGDPVAVRILGPNARDVQLDLRFGLSFGAVDVGDLVLYGTELRTLGLAINQANCAKTYDLGFGPNWIVQITPRKELA